MLKLALIEIGINEFEWPFMDQVDRAEYEISKINNRRRQLVTNNTYFKLYTQLQIIFQIISMG